MAKKSKEGHSKAPAIEAKAFEFLKEYLNTPSPTGFESKGQQRWLDYITPYIDEHLVDPYGTVVGVVNPKAPFKVVLEAHADEISWFVNYITESGLIYLKRNGGVDQQIAPSMRVIIHGDMGPVKAVFGWPAIHTRSAVDAKDVSPKVENLFLDCGARSKKEVSALGIRVGCVATYEEGFDELAYGSLIARAFDNRIGGFMIAEVARMLHLKKKKLPIGLYFVNAVQEEIGLRGAEMISRRIKPDVAIVTDVTHDTTTPMINKHIEGDTANGRGPSLTFGPAVHNKLLDLVRKVADKEDIPVQLRTVSRSTGTDTDAFAYSGEGTPSVLISIPLRYMHTTVEMVHTSDILNTIRLMYETVLTITPDTNLKYL